MAWKKKLAAVSTAVMLLLCMMGLMGCSEQEESESDTESEPVALEISEGGATVQVANPSIDEDAEVVATASYAFTVKNANEGLIAQNCTFDVTGYNEDGLVVFTGVSVVDGVYPGIETAVTGTAGMDAEQAKEGPVANIQVEPIMANVTWVESELSDSEIQNLFTIDYENASGEGDLLTVSATVTGDMADADKLLKTTAVENDLLGAHCVLLLFGSDGKILMGSDPSSVIIDQEFIDRVRKFEESKTPETHESEAPTNLLSSIANPPDFDRYELYVMPGLA